MRIFFLSSLHFFILFLLILHLFSSFSISIFLFLHFSILFLSTMILFLSSFPMVPSCGPQVLGVVFFHLIASSYYLADVHLNTSTFFSSLRISNNSLGWEKDMNFVREIKRREKESIMKIYEWIWKERKRGFEYSHLLLKDIFIMENKSCYSECQNI